MRTLVLALLSAAALSCSNTLTAPSSTADGASTPADQALRRDHSPGTRRATLYFYTDDPGPGSVEGLPVSLTGMPSGTSAVNATERRGFVTIDVPRTDTRLEYSIGANPLGVCPLAGSVPLPYGVRENWIFVHAECW